MKTILLRKLLFLSFCWFLSASTLQGQSSTFYQTYLYSGVDKAFALAPTLDGGYVMSGFFGVGFGVHRVLVIKTDSLGNEEWHKVYGHPVRNESWAIIPLDDGGYMVGATTSGDEFSGDFEDIYLLRLDEYGDTLWTKTHVQDGQEYLFDMKKCPGGGYIIAGGRLAPGDSYADGYALKIDDAGNKEWEQSYSIGTEFDIFWDVEILPDSSYVFNGEVEMGADVQFQNWLVRTAQDGTEVWSKQYGWVHTEFSRGGIIIDGEYIVTAGGTTSFSGNLNYDALITKVDMSGDTVWTKVIDRGDKEFSANTITLSNNGDYLVSAWNDNNSSPNALGGNLDLLRLTSDGDMIWSREILNGDNSEKSRDVIQNIDGSIVIAGETSEGCSGCAFLMKITEDGYLSNNTTVYSKNNSLSVFPNPSDGLFYIKLPDTPVRYSIQIYNSTGQQLDTYITDRQNVLTDIDLTSFPDGSYFLVLRDEENEVISSQTLLKITR
ncbi:MAG: hypothetical protein ACI9VN_002294 [Patescibacteria group bacterium]|jgi:hypothetical protein